MNNFKLREKIILILASLWLLLWVFPWAIWLASLPWVQLGLGILLFIGPGMAISIILAGERFTLPSHFTCGLALSVFFVGSLGVLGRIFHLPFEFIRPIFFLIGFASLLILIRYSKSRDQLYRSKRFSIVSLLSLCLFSVFAVIISFQGRFDGDDFSYLAHLTSWQHAQPLNFGEVFFHSGELDAIRFWVAMFPMSLAFLADVSNLHGLLLLGFYLEPCLMVIAIVCMYNLYEDMLPSEYQVITAILLQLTFLFILRSQLQPGSIFFNRLSEDKAFAAFILAPTFFLVIRYFVESFSLSSGILVLLSGFSLTLTHPVILAFSIFIAGVYAVIKITEKKKEYRKFIVVVNLLVFIMAPVILLRFFDTPTSPTSFDLKAALRRGATERRISYLEGTPFYGLNLDSIKIGLNQEKKVPPILSWSFLGVLGLGFVWALFNIRRKTVAPFFIATFLLFLLCAIPYTGWLVGYFVSARQLWRAPWLMPLGLVSAVLLIEFFQYVLYRISTRIEPQKQERAVFGVALVVSLFLITYFSIHVYPSRWASMENLVSYRSEIESFSVLGNYLETQIESPSIFISTPVMMSYLPGLSSKSKVIFFRNRNFSRDSISLEKIYYVLSEDPEITLSKRTTILKKQNIRYILVETAALKDYYASRPDLFRIERIGKFWLLEFLNPGF